MPDATKRSRRELARIIDHAVLRPESGLAELRGACEMARRCGVGCVCVKPCDVARAARLLAGSGVTVAAVVGFPHGSQSPAAKAAEAALAVADGAEELDMVLNIGFLRDGRMEEVRRDIAGVVAAAGGRCVKVILECCYLSGEQIVAACGAAEAAGASFVKTSTGFAAGGATVQNVALLRQCVGDRLGVKAAGGIKTLADAQAMLRAGATRLGCSRTEEILAEMND